MRCLFALLALLVAGAPAARADEIICLDPSTDGTTSTSAYEITAETWTEIRYRERKRGPVKTVPTPRVTDIRRGGSLSDAERRLLDAVAWLERGDFQSARAVLAGICRAGLWVKVETGEKTYRSYAADDRRGKRPPWSSEYAHFFLAKALTLEGIRSQDPRLLEEANRALIDQRAPLGGPTARTGGFLQRFDGGESRWYAEAMWLAALCLQHQGRTAEAAAAYEALLDKAVRLEIGPRWICEARLGQAALLEAQGRPADAIAAAKDATLLMRVQLGQAPHPRVRSEIGRLHGRARAFAAQVMLRRAEQSLAADDVTTLERFVHDGLPGTLRKTLAALPAAEREALVAGALDSPVQAVALNCVGWIHLQAKRYDEALLAFAAVAAKHFDSREWHARALYYLGRSADGAAEQAAGSEVRQRYAKMRAGARESLRSIYPDSSWATRD